MFAFIQNKFTHNKESVCSIAANLPVFPLVAVVVVPL